MRIFLAPLLALALLATGCANSGYSQYTAARIAETSAASGVEAARMHALGDAARSGDPATKAAAVMALALSGNKSVGVTAPPADPVLEWARILVPAATGAYGAYLNNGTQRHSIDAQTAQHSTTLGTLGTVATQGMTHAAKDPLVVHGPGIYVSTPVPGTTPAPGSYPE